MIKKTFLVLIFLIGVLTRFYQIEKIPTFIAHDELGYLINAQSISLSGTDITGTWNPFSLTPVTPTLAELTAPLIAPFYKLPLSPVLAGKLPFLIMSLIIPFLIAGIAFKFFKSKNIALITGVMALFNPWIWQLGRMAFDPYVSFFLYLLGAFLLLRLKNWYKLWAFLPFFVGFYQYQGHKLIFPFWVLFFVIYSARKSFIKKIYWKKIKPELLVLGLSAILFIFYTFVQLPSQQSSKRLDQILTPDSTIVAEKVNESRRLSLDSPINSIVINKYTVWSRMLLERLTNTYSFKYLFLEGQVGNSVWSVWNHGIFYVIDFVLIIFGFIYLIINKRYKFILLLFFGLIVFVLTSIISTGEAFFFRSALNIPLLIIISATGLEFIRKIVPKYVSYLLFMTYFLSILHFAFLYFVRYPIISSDRQFFSERIATEYLKRLPNSQNVILISPEPEFSASTYLFFTQFLTPENIEQIQLGYGNKEFIFNNFKFDGGCLPLNTNEFSEIIISRHDVRNCEDDEVAALVHNPLQIQSIKDSGSYFHIYNDVLCSEIELNAYINIRTLDSFDFENLSNEEFCKTWIQRSPD